MRKIIITFAAIIVATIASAQESYPTIAPYENTVQVTGRAEKEVVPDEIYMRIILNENDTKGKISVETQERNMVGVLQKLNINTEKELQVEDMSSNFKEYWLKKNQAITTKSYQLKLHDAATVAKVVSALEGTGISNTDVVRVAHSKIKEIQAQTRIEAMKNAQEVAKTLASAIGQKIVRAVYIADYNSDVMPPMRAMLSNKASFDFAESSESAPIIEFKTIKISYSVQVKFALD